MTSRGSIEGANLSLTSGIVFHRFCCPAPLSGGLTLLLQPLRFCFISFERSPRSDFTISFRGFYTTRSITCQRFFDVGIIFF